MHNRLIFLSVLALMIAGTAFCELSEVTKIPASHDIYFGMDKEGVYNTDTLKCEVNVTDINGSKVSIYSGIPMIQFNTSGLNVTENDIGILVLRAASINKQGNESSMIALMPVGSDWSEDSGYLDLFFNLKTIIDIVEKNDITKMGVSTDDDNIVAFDISKKLQDAKANGERASFLLMSISNSSYSVDFKSRETGEGPYLIVMPYPSEVKIGNGTSMISTESAINQTISNNTAINSTAINSTTTKNAAIINTTINHVETNMTAINNIVNNNIANNNTTVNSTAINKTAINQTAIQQPKITGKNSSSSVTMPMNNISANSTIAQRNATSENNTGIKAKPIAA